MKVERATPPTPPPEPQPSSQNNVKAAAVQQALLTSLGAVAPAASVGDPSPDQTTYDALQLIADLSKLALEVANGQPTAATLTAINSDVATIQADGDPTSILYTLGWTTNPPSGISQDIANFNGSPTTFLQDWTGKNPNAPNNNYLASVVANWYPNFQTFKLYNLPANEKTQAMMDIMMVNLSGLTDNQVAGSVMDSQFFGYVDVDGRGFGKNFSQLICAYFWMQDVGSSTTATPAQWQQFTTDLQNFNSLLPTAAAVGTNCPNYSKYILNGPNAFQTVMNNYFSPSSTSYNWPTSAWILSPSDSIKQIFGMLYGEWQSGQ